MYENFAIISSIVIFVLIMVLFTKESIDIVGVSLLGAFILCVIHTAIFNTTFVEYLALVDFEPLLFIISMQIVISVTEDNKIFQWLVLKTLHLTKGDHRKFFYLICLLAAFSSAIISDISIGIIFVPLVIRACKVLEIKPAPYLFGLSFTINIGSIYTPFSSSENIIIASSFGLDFLWFIKTFTFLVIPILLFTLLILDKTMLSKINPPTERRKQILLEIMNPAIVIEDKKKFILNAIYFSSIIIGFLFVPAAYIVAIFGGIMIILLNKENYVDRLKEIDWKVITFLIAIFIITGTMQINGTFDIIAILVEKVLSENYLLAAIAVLLMISVLSGFLAQVPTAIVFINLLTKIYGTAVPPIILVAFLAGINIGSNFLPQGAACDLITLSIAEKEKVIEFNYKSLLKNGSMITVFHIFNSIVFLVIISFIPGFT